LSYTNQKMGNSFCTELCGEVLSTQREAPISTYLSVHPGFYQSKSPSIDVKLKIHGCMTIACSPFLPHRYLEYTKHNITDG